MARVLSARVPTALAALDRALTPGDRDTGKEARRLVKEAYRDDLPGAMGALGSAWESFRGHFLKKDRPPDEMRTAADCAAWLIGVAYNRWQRERYQTRRSQGQQALGAFVAQGGSGPSLLERTPAPHEGHEIEVDLADFRKALEDELERFTRHLSVVKRQIIRLSFFEGKTPQEIHELLGVSVSKCKEVPSLWRRHLAQRYPVTLDFLGDDPPPA